MGRDALADLFVKILNFVHDQNNTNIMARIRTIISTLLLLCLSFHVKAQEGFQIGFSASPSWKINMTTQKQTGIRSYQSGYGFSIGIPVKYWINDYSAFSSGLEYDFSAFDGFQNGQLVSSVRFNALHLPLMFNVNLTGHWYALVGAGLLYNLSARDLNAVTFGTDITSQTNRLQPYLGLGISSLNERDRGLLEYGVQLRYQVRDIWINDYAPLENFNAHLISADLVIHYYF